MPLRVDPGLRPTRPSRRVPLSVVNITSILARVGARSIPQASYAASKGGLEQLTRELANQWARSSIG